MMCRLFLELIRLKLVLLVIIVKYDYICSSKKEIIKSVEYSYTKSKWRTNYGYIYVDYVKNLITCIYTY